MIAAVVGLDGRSMIRLNIPHDAEARRNRAGRKDVTALGHGPAIEVDAQPGGDGHPVVHGPLVLRIQRELPAGSSSPGRRPEQLHEPRLAVSGQVPGTGGGNPTVSCEDGEFQLEPGVNPVQPASSVLKQPGELRARRVLLTFGVGETECVAAGLSVVADVRWAPARSRPVRARGGFPQVPSVSQLDSRPGRSASTPRGCSTTYPRATDRSRRRAAWSD